MEESKRAIRADQRVWKHLLGVSPQTYIVISLAQSSHKTLQEDLSWYVLLVSGLGEIQIPTSLFMRGSDPLRNMLRMGRIPFFIELPPLTGCFQGRTAMDSERISHVVSVSRFDLSLYNRRLQACPYRSSITKMRILRKAG